MNEDDKKEVNTLIDRKLRFSQSKIGDTPTDNLQLTNRRYVNMNGTTSSRPNSSIATLGQQYFDTTIGRPLFWNGTNWIDAAGSVR